MLYSRLVKVCALFVPTKGLGLGLGLGCPYTKVLVDMLFALVQLFSSGLGLAANLREFPFTALYGVGGDGFVSRFVQVCALFVPTEGFYF